MKRLLCIFGWMILGAFILAALEAAWIVKAGLIVRKSVAEESRKWDRIYSVIAVNPFNEMPPNQEGIAE